MLERALTTRVCSQIVAFLIRRGWTVARIARTLEASPDYVGRIQSEKQSFQMADVETLARAAKLAPHRLIFNSFDREGLEPDLRGLYDLTRAEVERHESLRQVLRKPAKKRRVRTKAA